MLVMHMQQNATQHAQATDTNMRHATACKSCKGSDCEGSWRMSLWRYS